MKRREFIKALAGGGALVAASRLPVFGDDNPAVFHRRGIFERLHLGYVDIKAGAAKPFSLLHISDTHLTSAYGNESTNRQRLAKSRSVTFGGRQEEALRDSVAWAQEHADFILHTGDLIDFQSQANYDLARAAFFKAGENGVPDWPGINAFASGNHEISPEMWLGEEKCTNDEAWRAKYSPETAAGLGIEDLSFGSTVVNGVNIVTMDDSFGTFNENQVARFEAEVKKGLPILLCLHVPLYTERLWTATRVYWSRDRKFSASAMKFPATGDWKRQQEHPVTREFLAWLKGVPLLKGVLAGHLHIDVRDRFSPTAMEYVVGGNFMFHGQHVLLT